MKISKLIILCICAVCPVLAQPGSLILSELIDLPTAKTIPQASIQASLRMFPLGGLLANVGVGLTRSIDIGVSYGGANVIGMGDVDLHPRPEVNIRYLLFEELYLSPAVVIGFNSQGLGAYDKSRKRYGTKSRGFYASASKNTSFLGGLGLHGGINWSLETEDGDTDPNLFIGAHKWINPELVVLAEYDTAINDNEDNAIGSGKGYLNAAIRWNVEQTFFVEFDWKNILENYESSTGSSREIKLVYMTTFLQ